MHPLPASVIRVDPMKLPEPAAVAWLAPKGSQGHGLRQIYPMTSPWNRSFGSVVLRYRIDGLNSPDTVEILEAFRLEQRIHLGVVVARFEGLLGANLVQTALVEVDLDTLPTGVFQLGIETLNKVFQDLSHPELAVGRGTIRSEYTIQIRE